MCIDACPVGALTSGTYRYKTRPWEMNHVATVCTHCGDGCKTTLGVRSTSDGSEIVRGDNRDKSGINGDFLCNKGRYAFDFANSPERITQPLVRQPNGELKPVSWEDALDLRRQEAPRTPRHARRQIASASSAATASPTKRPTCCRSSRARSSAPTTSTTTAPPTTSPSPRRSPAHDDRTASLRDTLTATAVLLVGGDPTNQAPLTAWNLRTNVRLNGARLYIANTAEIKLRRQAKAFLQVARFGYGALAAFLAGDDSAAESLVAERDALAASATPSAPKKSSSSSSAPSCAAAISSASSPSALTMPERASSPCSPTTPTRAAQPTWACCPTCSPATRLPPAQPASAEYAIPTDAPASTCSRSSTPRPRASLSALYVVGSNPVARYGIDPATLKNTFVVVQDMFLTETAALADVVLPAANLYEKSGSVTNSYGDLQLVKKAADRAGVRTDFEMIVRIADKMGANVRKLVPFGKGTAAPTWARPAAHSPARPTATPSGSPPTTSSRASAPSTPSPSSTRFSASSPATTSSSACNCSPATTSTFRPPPPAHSAGLVQITNRRDLVLPANDTLFTSGTLGRYSAMLIDLQQNEARRSRPDLQPDRSRLTKYSFSSTLA